MSSANEVSIIVPVYCKTVEELGWLDECLASATSQGCEVVCVDDGSAVDIQPVTGKYNITLIRRRNNKGVSFTRNQAAAAATRKLLLPLDCDDRLKPGAVEALLKEWDGDTPVYPDVELFGTKVEAHYYLLDFDCDHLRNHVGFTSVNVLHLKEQWYTLGGWDTSIDFYEDGEYNARLMGRYCGKHLPLPLVEYRQHPSQRTQTYKQRAGVYAQALIKRIRSYEFMCSSCGSKRRSATTNTPVISGQRSGNVEIVIGEAPVNLPSTFENMILQQYLGGKGRARHYYTGGGSGRDYYVQYGEWTYVDPRDVDRGFFHSPTSKQDIPDPQPASVMPQAAPTVRSNLIEAVERPAEVQRAPKTPIQRAALTNDLPEIATMSYEEIRRLDITPDMARQLLPLEQNGLNRSKVISFLRVEAGRVQSEDIQP